RGQDLRIPTLQDVLQRFPEQRLLVEIKQVEPPMEAALCTLLTDAGRSTGFATSALMVLMFCGVAGRILGGRLGDQIGALPAYMIMSFGQTISVFWFPFLDGAAGLYLLAAFFGFSYSGVMSSILVCTRMMVTPGYSGRAMSITSFFGWAGMGLGGFLGGVIFDFFGRYEPAFAFAALMGVINLLVLAAFQSRINRHRGGGAVLSVA
ncbi:MAG: MFS transporter, partial [Pseudomonadota bacterium]